MAVVRFISVIQQLRMPRSLATVLLACVLAAARCRPVSRLADMLMAFVVSGHCVVTACIQLLLKCQHESRQCSKRVVVEEGNRNRWV